MPDFPPPTWAVATMVVLNGALVLLIGSLWRSKPRATPLRLKLVFFGNLLPLLINSFVLLTRI